MHHVFPHTVWTVPHWGEVESGIQCVFPGEKVTLKAGGEVDIYLRHLNFIYQNAEAH